VRADYKAIANHQFAFVIRQIKTGGRKSVKGDKSAEICRSLR